MSVRTVTGDVVSRPLDAAASVVRYTAQGTSSVIRTGSVKFSRGWSWGYGLWVNRSRYDYKQEVGDPYNNSAVVAVVGWIARNFPESPVIIVKLPKGEGDPETTIRPAETGHGRMLELLERPNPYYSGVLQWMPTVVDVYCGGNAYWLKVRGPMNRVEELWWLPSWMVEPVWDPEDPNSFIEGYAYKVDGITYYYRREDIVHFRDGIDPRNTRKGLSRLASLYREIFTDDEAANMTASLMRNLGVPGVIMAPANTTGPTARFADPEDMKKTFMEKFGGDKRGEPMINTVPTDVKILSWSPQQMDMRSLRKIPEERISAVMGVAAIVAGLGAGLDRSTFANFGEARKAAYQEAVIPGHRLFAADLEVQLLPEFGDTRGLDVRFDWTKASAMQEAASEVWKRAQDAATKGLLTRASFKRMVGLPVDKDDDIYLLPNNFQLLKPGEIPEPKPAPAALGSGGPPTPAPKNPVKPQPARALSSGMEE